VGARSYSSWMAAPRPAAPAAAGAPAPVPEDPLKQELTRHRQELAQAQGRLLEHLRQLQQSQEEQQQVEQELSVLATRQQGPEQQRGAVARAAAEQARASESAALSLAELRQRGRRLAAEVRELEQLPSPKKTLRYRTPVSRPVHSEELMFECRQGRIAFIDIAAFLAEVRDGLEEKAKLLRTQWQVEDVTRPVGAFRLCYQVERERGLLDSIAGGGTPDPGADFRYGLSMWQVEPVAPVRGESVEAALAPGSE